MLIFLPTYEQPALEIVVDGGCSGEAVSSLVPSDTCVPWAEDISDSLKSTVAQRFKPVGIHKLFQLFAH